MKRNDISAIVNTITDELLEGTTVAEDLSNLVDVGSALFNVTSTDALMNQLIDAIGKRQISSRIYQGTSLEIYKDSWDYGAARQKISFGALPESDPDPAWDLVDGQSYDPNVFYQPSVLSKFYSQLDSHMIKMSFNDMQVKSAFSSPSELNALFTGIETQIKNSMTIKNTDVAKRAINNMIAITMYNEIGLASSPNAMTSGQRAINLLSLYNAKQSDITGAVGISAAESISNPDFLRFSTEVLLNYKDYMTEMSKNHNVGGLPRFTNTEDLHLIMLSQFARSLEVNMQSEVYNKELVQLPGGFVVTPHWQTPGLKHEFADTSKIAVTIAGAKEIFGSDAPISPVYTGILAVMFDDEAVGMTNYNERVTTNRNDLGEFTNYWHKVNLSLFNDVNENFIVFYVADPID